MHVASLGGQSLLAVLSFVLVVLSFRRRWGGTVAVVDHSSHLVLTLAVIAAYDVILKVHARAAHRTA